MSKQPPTTTEPKISLFDVFIGKGRTIRGSQGPPGLPLLQTNYGLVRKPAAKATEAKAIEEADKTASVKKTEEKEDDEQGGGNARVKTPDDLVFTPEQDAELLKLKSENKSWKQISETIGKPGFVLKKRFKDIRRDQTLGQQQEFRDINVTFENKKGGKKSGSGSKKYSKEEWEQYKRKQQRQHRQHHHHQQQQQQQLLGHLPPPSAASFIISSSPYSAYSKLQRPHSAAAAPHSPDASSSSTLVELQEDFDISCADMQLLVQLFQKDMDELCVRLSSAFFDKTGRRLEPRVIGRKLRGLDVDSALR